MNSATDSDERTMTPEEREALDAFTWSELRDGKEAVRWSEWTEQLEAALRICKDLESASRAHDMWGYEDDWNALRTFISQWLDSERGCSPNDPSSATKPGSKAV
jgi:hypothetical protein